VASLLCYPICAQLRVEFLMQQITFYLWGIFVFHSQAKCFNRVFQVFFLCFRTTEHSICIFLFACALDLFWFCVYTRCVYNYICDHWLLVINLNTVGVYINPYVSYFSCCLLRCTTSNQLCFVLSSVFAGCFTWQGNYKDEARWPTSPVTSTSTMARRSTGCGSTMSSPSRAAPPHRVLPVGKPCR
jgi:hypothetical protein